MKKLIGLMALTALVSCGGKKDHALVISNTNALNFGNVTLNTSKTVLLTVANDGEEASIFQNVVVDHANSNFEIVDAETTCKPDLSIGLQATCVIALKFTPTNDTRFVDSITISYSSPEEKSKLINKSYSTEGIGFLNCSAKPNWLASYNVGVSKAQNKMLDETAAAQASAGSKTELDGYRVGYPVGYQEKYQSSYNTAYNSAYQSSYNTAYNANKNDYFACSDGKSDATRDAREDADNNAFILGTEEGYDDGDYYGEIDGYDWGYFEAENACGEDYPGSPGPDYYNFSPQIDPNTDAALALKCEGQGYGATYDFDHYNREYNKFLSQNVPYQNGLTTGKADGRRDGTNQGIAAGDADGRRVGAAEGKQAGLDNSYNVCYAEKYTIEYDYEYSRLYPYYYDIAYEEGEYDGFNRGFEDGWFDAQYEVCGYDYSKRNASKALTVDSGLTKLLSARKGMVVKSPKGLVSVAQTKLTKVPYALEISEDPMMQMIYNGYVNYVKEVHARALKAARAKAVFKHLSAKKAPVKTK